MFVAYLRGIETRPASPAAPSTASGFVAYLRGIETSRVRSGLGLGSERL